MQIVQRVVPDPGASSPEAITPTAGRSYLTRAGGVVDVIGIDGHAVAVAWNEGGTRRRSWWPSALFARRVARDLTAVDEAVQAGRELARRVLCDVGAAA